MESSINSQIRINTTQNTIVSKSYGKTSILNTQYLELNSYSAQLPQLNLQLRTLEMSESPQKRVRKLKSVRIREQETIYKRISKSFELRNMNDTQKQQRRKSGIEQLSQKQLNLDCQYPKTIVQQQEVIQRTKERKRTLFKRMSSILIKHQNTIRNISNLENHRNIEKQQQQMNDESNVIQCQEVKKQKFRSSVIESQKPRVVLNITRKSRKAFASIQSYISEKTTIVTKEQTMNQNNSINQTNPFMSYKCFQSLTDLNEQIQNNSQLNQGRFEQIKPTYPLPDIKLISSARNNYTQIDMNQLKQKKQIINIGNSQRKKRISINQ